MSAIWGAISLNEREITKKERAALKEPFNHCVIDRIEEQEQGNCYMGCGIQYFTVEA